MSWLCWCGDAETRSQRVVGLISQAYELALLGGGILAAYGSWTPGLISQAYELALLGVFQTPNYFNRKMMPWRVLSLQHLSVLPSDSSIDL